MHKITSATIHFVSYIFMMLCVTLTSCRNNDEPLPEPVVEKNMTVIVYIAAENSLSKYYNSDLREMVQAASQIPLDCNFIVYVDANTLPVIYTINAQQGKVTYKELTEHDSCDPEVFRSTMQDILKEFPAKHYGLVMWSHASGWIPAPHKSFGVDNNINSNSYDNGTEMNICDLNNAFAQLGVHWDYILFDACFMQCVESDYELRNATDYIIASPAEIPGQGAPYNKIMSYLVNPVEDNLESGEIPASIQAIVQEYYNYYKNNDGIIISAVKCSELENLLNMTRTLIPDYYTKASMFNTSNIQPYCKYAHVTRWKPDFFDIGSTMYNMLSASDYAEWIKQVQRTVPCHFHTKKWFSIYTGTGFNPSIIDPDHVTSMSIFIPNAKYDSTMDYNNDIKDTQWYRDFNAK